MVQEIEIIDITSLKRNLNYGVYLLVLIAIILAIINIDMFQTNPRYIHIEDEFWKNVLLIFTIVFVLTIFVWNKRKYRMLSIIQNGKKVKGKYLNHTNFRPNNTSSFILIEYEYIVNGKSYNLTSKAKSKSQSDVNVIYHVDNPERSIVYEHLKKNIKKLIRLYT